MQLAPSSGVNAEFFLKMKDQSVYASVGRGSTTDEDALIDALRSGKLDGAVLDVTEIEPLPADSPLWQMDNVILTPHISGSSASPHFLERVWDIFFENVQRLRNRLALSRVCPSADGSFVRCYYGCL